MADLEMKNKLHKVIINQIATDLDLDEKYVERVINKFFMGVKVAVNNHMMVDLKELGQFWLSYLAIWKKIARIKKFNRRRSGYKRKYNREKLTKTE